VTEDYELAYCYDMEQPNEPATLILDALRTEGWTFADVHGHGQCDHCGARIRYVAVLKHKPSHKLIQVGETCLANRFERATAEFHALRKAAELDRAEQKIKNAVKGFLLGLDKETAEYLNPWNDDLPEDVHYIIQDMRSKLRRYGSLSERQVELARKLWREMHERRQQQAEREKNAPTKVRIPDGYIGRATFTGTVLGTKYVDNPFDYYGNQTLKVLLQVMPHHGQAFTLWGTVPSGDLSIDKGDTVRWTATIERSRDDETHGYFKRPRVAK
jgi:hypothetical protein